MLFLFLLVWGGEGRAFATHPVHFFKLGLNNSKYGKICATVAFESFSCRARYWCYLFYIPEYWAEYIGTTSSELMRKTVIIKMAEVHHSALVCNVPDLSSTEHPDHQNTRKNKIISASKSLMVPPNAAISSAYTYN